MSSSNKQQKPTKEEVKDPNAEVIKINKWDGTAVKHAIDDSVKTALLDRPNCFENFGLVDGRLFICGLAVGIALLALGWDYRYPFPQSKPVLIGCVAAYFVLMGILTLYTTFREKNIFAVAVQKDGNNVTTWQASSEMRKFDDKYTLYITRKNSKNVKETSASKSCAHYIDTNGTVFDHLVAKEVSRLINSLNEKEK